MKQFTEDYCSFEIAQLLKEKGFPQEEYVNVFPYYTQNGNLYFGDINTVRQRYCVEAVAPSQSLALKWLREVHRIFISIMCCTYPTLNKVTWIPDITTFESVFPDNAVEYDTYEEAVEATLLYVLKNLI